MNRVAKYKVKVFAEGNTECNYISGLKKISNINFTFEDVDMKGGGYSNFLKKVNTISPLNCIVCFVIIDLDNAESDKKNLDELIKVCNDRSKKTKIPYILIGNNYDFEYFCCCHFLDYHNGDTSLYIKRQLHYNNVDEFKADSNMYNVLNNAKSKSSFELALEKTKVQFNANNTYFKYGCVPFKKGLDIKFKNTKLIINKEALNTKHSNFMDFFTIIKI